MLYNDKSENQREDKNVKMFRRVMVICLALCLAFFCGALLVRILLQEYYPKDTTRIVFTEELTDYYFEHQDTFGAKTQKIRFPYDDAKATSNELDAKREREKGKGNFFAKNLIVVPEAGNLQVTLRHNKSALAKVAAYYDLTETPAVADGLFRYKLYASYLDRETGETYTKEYDSSYLAESSFLMYRYGKLVFDGVDFENAVWMRVDIYYGDETETFGEICVYESRTDNGTGEIVDRPLSSYKISKGDLPKSE